MEVLEHKKNRKKARVEDEQQKEEMINEQRYRKSQVDKKDVFFVISIVERDVYQQLVLEVQQYPQIKNIGVRSKRQNILYGRKYETQLSNCYYGLLKLEEVFQVYNCTNIINSKDTLTGDTPLIKAVKSGNISIIQLLIREGADCNSQNVLSI